MSKSYKFIFLDINNIILDEAVEIKEGHELKKEIKEKFEFVQSIIDNFIENHILIDVEKEEKFLVNNNSFIYQIEDDVMKNYQFFLFRKINKDMFNVKVNAIFIVLDLEKDKDLENLESIFENIMNNTQIKLYFLGIYKSKDNIKLGKENIVDIFLDHDLHIDYEYKELNINNENKNEINKEINKYIEDAMFDVYFSDSEINFGMYKKVNATKDYNENQSISNCEII